MLINCVATELLANWRTFVTFSHGGSCRAKNEFCQSTVRR